MAGTLVSSTLSDGTNSTSTTNAIQGSAKAWVNFNGTNGSIRASYNVSSVSRTATGRYTINFTNAFTDTNYSVVGTTGQQALNQPMGVFGKCEDSSILTTSAISVYNLANCVTPTDAPYCYVAVFR